jgi:hypothetical protein
MIARRLTPDDMPLNGLRILPLLAAVMTVPAGEFHLAREVPTLDRWMYPFNFQPGTRPVAPTYGSFDPRFDARDAQFLLGWDFGSTVETNAGPARYLLRRVAVTLTSIAPNPPNVPFVFDPTYDSYRTYDTNAPAFEPDADPGRPVELFGVGFRNGFAADTFLAESPFGETQPTNPDIVSIESRNAFAAVFDTNGVLIDVSNHAAQLNRSWTNQPFEVRPWAIGMVTNAAPSEPVPDDAKVTFELDLSDPLIVAYLQRALHEGRLRLMVSSLSPAGQSTPGGTGGGGAGAYPWWATSENLLYDPPHLTIEGSLISDADSDSDNLPDDWELFWLGNLDRASLDDPDTDGASNADELVAGTHPLESGSALRIADARIDPAGRATLRFSIAPSRSYVVETSSDLNTWTLVEGTVAYTDKELADWTEAAAPAASSRFFRVGLP